MKNRFQYGVKKREHKEKKLFTVGSRNFAKYFIPQHIMVQVDQTVKKEKEIMIPLIFSFSFFFDGGELCSSYMVLPGGILIVGDISAMATMVVLSENSS